MVHGWHIQTLYRFVLRFSAMRSKMEGLTKCIECVKMFQNILLKCCLNSKIPGGEITEDGLRNNISVGIQYISAWLRGTGAVAIFNLMEDAATAEISRSQVWQWCQHPDGILDDGRKITIEMVKNMIPEELAKYAKPMAMPMMRKN